jgi:RimJ/RimL family protein N-acetyltransferase
MTDVRLVRLRSEDLAVMARARKDWTTAQGFPEAFGPAEHAELAERIDRSGEFDGTELLLGIQVDGRLAGEVQARQPRMGLPPGVFELGIDLFDEADRGNGFGRVALTQLLSRLFKHEGAHRVQLTTDVDNAAMRALSERLGFGFEGVMRGFMPSIDGPRDYAIYAMTIDDYEDVKVRWTSTS